MGSMFAGIGSAQVFERGQYLVPGKFLVKVLRCFTKKTRNKGDAFIAEIEVLESSVPDQVAVGSKRSWYQGMSDADIALPELKKFSASVCGVDLKDKQAAAEFSNEVEELLVNAVGKENIFSGAVLSVECWQKETKKGNDFTVHEWTHVEPPDALRAA